jgi:hypothetical protein
VSTKAFVIRHGKHKKTGHRRWGKQEWAQVGLAALLSRNAVPEHISDVALARLVQDELEHDPRYLETRYKLSRQTVTRAWKTLREANG